MAGFVLANGSMGSNTSGEGEIRRALIEADLVDCMVALPKQLFYSTQISVCLWFITRNKNNGKFRDRRKETLFIDASQMGTLVDRVHRELTDVDIIRIASTYHAWRGDKGASLYKDEAGFCKSANTKEIADRGYKLAPSPFVGNLVTSDEDDPFIQKMPRLVNELSNLFKESKHLENNIRQNLRGIGYEC